MHPFKLGRLQEFDEKSRNFPIRNILRATELKTPKTNVWEAPPSLDQGQIGSCVGNAWAQEMAARPGDVQGITEETALKIYHKAQTLDEYPGEGYEGTSVLAGVKAVQALYPQALDSYRWAFGLDDMIITLGYFGPVVLGINWYESMFHPDAAGHVKVTGAGAGGHAILAVGVNVEEKSIRLKNSWGPKWGDNGCCVISYADMEKLLHERGEACVPIGQHTFVGV